LNTLFPCRLLPPDHDLLVGTIRRIESRLSPGGIPINTGWMPEGMWVAITLDNLAEAHLARGDGDAAARYLYPVLNHGTPFYTWCEERGQEPGTAECSGDRQHLWTPVSVVRFLRDSLVMEEEDGLHLCSGIVREWLGSGEPLGIASAPTYYGCVSFRMQYDAVSGQVTGRVEFAEDFRAAWAVLHVHLPDGMRVVSVNPESGAVPLPDGSGVRWDAPRGIRLFTAAVRR
jgi:hypothetical protein